MSKGDFQKGYIPWNKGLKRPEMSGEKNWKWVKKEKKICLGCKKEFLVSPWQIKGNRVSHCSIKCRKTNIIINCAYCSREFRRNKYAIETAKNNYCSKKCADIDYKGKSRSPNSEFKRGDVRITGKNNRNWKGGVTPIHEMIRKSFEYEEWRTAVFTRDNYTCKHCGQIGGRLEADHIKPFSLYPDLRLDINNGRTLCYKCHRETETYAGRIKNYGS